MDFRFRPPIISAALIAGMLMTTASKGQDVFTHLTATPALTASQKHYLEVAESWPFTGKYRFVTVNLRELKNDAVWFNCPDADLLAIRMKRELRTDGIRYSWIGEFPGHPGNVHAVYRPADNAMVAHIQYEDMAFLLRPLGDGLHALFEYDMTLDDGCGVNGSHSRPPRGTPQEEGVDMHHPDINQALNDAAANDRSTGECNIRVYVVYTSATAAAVEDIMTDIINMVNMGNTGYQNSGIVYSIELAAAELISYTETGDINDDLDNLTGTSDGMMDGVHTSRTLWEADQVSLLTSTNSGLAWLSSAYSDQFSVTGVPNFYAFTFHHELSHNALCTHALNQSTQPGTAPYAGWGEPTTGCFRTVMAYQDACGTGSCPRQNIFSDDDANQWTCGGDNYTPGTSNNRNQDRLVLSRSTMVGHNTVGNTVTYTAAYTFSNNEALHMAANQTLTYTSVTNTMAFNSGSEGSFRASDAVTLGTGFWAKSGSVFAAYLENCTALRTAGPDNVPLTEAERDDVDMVTLDVRPNPFRYDSDVVLHIMSGSAQMSVHLYDQRGRVVQTLADKLFLNEGTHLFRIHADELSAGTYLVRAIDQAGEQMLSKVIVKSH